MYVRPSAPRAIGGVLDDAISLYRHAYSKVAPLTIAAAIIVALPGFSLGLRMVRAQAGGLPAIFALMRTPGYWLTYALVFLVHLAVYGGLLAALETFIERGDVSVGEALGAGASLLPRILAVSVLFSLMVGVGLVLLIVPGVYLSGIYQLAVVALVVERAGISQSFGISRALIKGYWWRSVSIVTVGFVILFVFSLIAGVVNGVVAGIFGFGTSVALLSQSIMGIVINVFLMPLLPCFLLALYHDLKLRHEGGDLAARVDALAVS